MATKLNWLIGAASFGANYGVSNHRQTTQKEVGEILELAVRSEWFGVDTAPAYGRSEELLGQSGLGSLAVFTKLPNGIRPESLRDSVIASLRSLKVKSLEGLTFHNHKDLVDNFEFFSRELSRHRNDGLIARWGVSVYSPQEIVDVLRVATPDYFQAPVNLLDRRFLDPLVYQQIKDSGAKLQARSIFLQGLLANPIDSLPSYFDEWKDELRRAEQVASEIGSDLRRFAIDFIRSEPAISSAVIGIHNTHQMQQICTQISEPAMLDPRSVLDPSSDTALIDPRIWFR